MPHRDKNGMAQDLGCSVVKWSQKTEGVLFSALFEKGLVDPRFNKACDIDPIKVTIDRKFDICCCCC